jgi:hypothetical protein
MCNSKLVDTPIVKSHALSVKQYPKIKEWKKQLVNVLYSSAIGSLMYAIMCTRPNIYFVVGTVSRYSSNLGIAYSKIVKGFFNI